MNECRHAIRHARTEQERESAQRALKIALDGGDVRGAVLYTSQLSPCPLDSVEESVRQVVQTSANHCEQEGKTIIQQVQVHLNAQRHLEMLLERIFSQEELRTLLTTLVELESDPLNKEPAEDFLESLL